MKYKVIVSYVRGTRANTETLELEGCTSYQDCVEKVLDLANKYNYDKLMKLRGGAVLKVILSIALVLRDGDTELIYQVEGRK